ncbi:hypothetical protein, partial [Endozoicomonas sp. YOMI1]|uniref:hypothetical protein n=1 Tax=Endozoicomonas sp. YOMI1 TaxID=2828739 RepID=UPI0021486132
FEVIEIPINKLWNQDSMKICIDQIKTKVETSRHRAMALYHLKEGGQMRHTLLPIKDSNLQD